TPNSHTRAQATAPTGYPDPRQHKAQVSSIFSSSIEYHTHTLHTTSSARESYIIINPHFLDVGSSAKANLQQKTFGSRRSSIMIMRHSSGAARFLAALALLLPTSTLAAAAPLGTTAVAGAARGLEGEEVAVGFRGRLAARTVRRLQEDEGCTENTSVGDAEAGIAQYDDPDACLREGPLVGCNVLGISSCRLCVTNGGEAADYLPSCPEEVEEIIEEIFPQTRDTDAPSTAPPATETPLLEGATPAPADVVATPIPSEVGGTSSPAATGSPAQTAAPGVVSTASPGATSAPAIAT
ncbi:unnamed protein product, partial [Ectocarpus sp. 12 AP-2014]